MLKAFILINLAVLLIIFGLVIGQFGPANLKLANWIGWYAGLLVVLAIFQVGWLERYDKVLIFGPAIALILYALYRK